MLTLTFLLYTQQKTNSLIRIDENSTERCPDAHIVQCLINQLILLIDDYDLNGSLTKAL